MDEIILEMHVHFMGGRLKERKNSRGNRNRHDRPSTHSTNLTVLFRYLMIVPERLLNEMS